MARTPENAAAVAGKLTASRVAPLIRGDRESIIKLYEFMLGEREEDDLSDFWPAQLGIATEQLNLDWYQRKQNTPVTRRGEVVVSHVFNWAAATLDGWDERLKCPIECKHVGGREALEIVIDRYQPQMQWQMLVTGAESCALSVIEGANEPRVEYVDRAQGYIDDMVERATWFMMCVDMRMPPVAMMPIAPPVDPTAVINMTGNNKWATVAADYLANYDSMKIVEDCKKVLKSMVPPDAKRCFGYGVIISRDKAGTLTLRKDKDHAQRD